MKRTISVLLLVILLLSAGAWAFAEDWNPDVSFTTVDTEGREWTDETFKEASLTMLNFWAYWCPPCVGEMPDLQKLSEDYPDLQLLGVSMEEFVQDNIKKMEELEVKYPTLRMTDSLLEVMDTGYIPTTIFVNSEGRIVGETYVGGKSYKEWAGIVEKLLEENPRVEKNTDEPSDGKGATEDGGR